MGASVVDEGIKQKEDGIAKGLFPGDGEEEEEKNRLVRVTMGGSRRTKLLLRIATVVRRFLRLGCKQGDAVRLSSNTGAFVSTNKQRRLRICMQSEDPEVAATTLLGPRCILGGTAVYCMGVCYERDPCVVGVPSLGF